MTRANVETGAVLRRELLALAEEDRRTREALAAAGTLWDGYHPDMEAIHRRNAARLAREPPIPLPRDRARFDREYQAWLVRTGWRR